jgi:uncharacterized membrane protein YheB (UPF0754 family)
LNYTKYVKANPTRELKVAVTQTISTVLKTLFQTLQAFNENVPFPLVPILQPKNPNLKPVARSILHVVLDSMRALQILSELIEKICDDHFECQEYIMVLVNKEQGVKNSNLDVLLNIFDFMLNTDHIQKLWNSQEEIIGLVGQQRLSNSGRFDLVIFKALFKLTKASGLAAAP